ncbi:alpha-glucuronidase family glycosyl hydrolase [Paenibacillus physcomitrellae]|uniref:Xylan alpha-1,2-glucuronidase n=1 Tax=Paenibacillus physcomitrellae TaxID=1619311 RepID=A0ABQ1GRM9_9BACL|nr:alpha-glucuronidase family glycosyl hydrolase [Paenibacillus physcomitrellae]GGA48312.1 xylan alpha-1,2-glucuronidase [Paenibacillus physcomitrellae]
MSIPEQVHGEDGYLAWLPYRRQETAEWLKRYKAYRQIVVAGAPEDGGAAVIHSAAAELARGLEGMSGLSAAVVNAGEVPDSEAYIQLALFGSNPEIDGLFPEAVITEIGAEGFAIQTDAHTGRIVIAAAAPAGLLYGAFHLLRLFGTGQSVNGLNIRENPVNPLRMINHWDNMDGSIERGYAGKSIFFENNRFKADKERIRDYARLLASVGINAVSINNVNVHKQETLLITDEFLPDVAEVAAIFRDFAVKLFLSVNYAAPLEMGELPTADPLDPAVQEWWQHRIKDVYSAIPDFGGYVVKADSENRPGPFTYGRDHADGANMLAEALDPFGGIVIWRCFVYNCKQDWRDRKTDRAKAAYDHFKPLDGRFKDNVVLQVKNGPIDFQVREPISPLLGAMPSTHQVLELQITQEYTGQQRHLCYLVPQWKEILDFDTYLKGEGSTVKRIASGELHGSRLAGIAAVSNIGDDTNWTGHLLAQANLYGYGRLIWNPGLTSPEIAEEWIRLTFGNGSEQLIRTVQQMLLDSWGIYESYTAPLGVGFMVNPDHHYGPNVEGYEYSMWGTYHFADWQGIGVDRTKATGTGYTGQYAGSNCERYESLETCPDELLLFFHHVPYTHKLHSGKTVIQHIYDTHFEGAEQAERFAAEWEALAGSIEEGLHQQVAERLAEQAEHAKEWRDRINTYFYRRCGIADEQGRTIY